MEKIKMILDCDTGHDDAIALMMAARHPAIELLGVTVVAGNQTLDKTLPNTLKVCQALGIDCPVYGGMSLPLVRDQITAGEVHGESGLDGPVFPPLTRKAEPEHAVQFLIRTLMASDGDITLVPVGPLTNIAAAMRLEPAILPKIRQIVLMGGAYGLGNSTPAAEFNLFADPEAAHIVFSSGVPLVMMGLDLTNQTVCTMDVIERMEALGNRAGKLFGEIMRFTFNTQREINGLEAGPVHDVTCVAWLVAPELFTLKPAHVEIDLSHGPCYGRTVCDFVLRQGKAVNCQVGITLDREKFWDLVADTLARYE